MLIVQRMYENFNHHYNPEHGYTCNQCIIEDDLEINILLLYNNIDNHYNCALPVYNDVELLHFQLTSILTLLSTSYVSSFFNVEYECFGAIAELLKSTPSIVAWVIYVVLDNDEIDIIGSNIELE
ncbi:hypothetical protein HZH68_007888 [Vespula germanica]|uniref:Uncharacterized protein n=1 Tax=Vespula germanica TaxID=30212 RepID=A0A834K511_VESGE|nr:hypothetical protein HZH68_007888 [Vespula germanica]